jgi:hypothetical protein
MERRYCETRAAEKSIARADSIWTTHDYHPHARASHPHDASASMKLQPPPPSRIAALKLLRWQTRRKSRRHQARNNLQDHLTKRVMHHHQQRRNQLLYDKDLPFVSHAISQTYKYKPQQSQARFIGQVCRRSFRISALVGPVTEARRGDPLPSPSWSSEARALEGETGWLSGLGNGTAESWCKSKMCYPDSLCTNLALAVEPLPLPLPLPMTLLLTLLLKLLTSLPQSPLPP